MSNRSGLATARALTRGCLIGLALCGLALGQHGSIITFDAPGAGTGFRQGTTATSINAAGVITGYYVDASNFYHGFVRSPSGVFTVFDASGPGTGTLANGINDYGAVTGYYIDTYGLDHGFVRSPSGGITTFDAPPVSGTSGTYAFSINDAGAVTGLYFEGAVAYSFVRSASGAFALFGVPGAGGDGLNGTRAASINNAGAVAGSYSYNSPRYTLPNHGFVRAAGGAIATFTAPYAGTSPNQGTQPSGINDAGTIVGNYIDATGITHGFMRGSSGVFTTIDVSGAIAILPVSINDAGAIAGSYSIPSLLSYGFVRSPSGVFVTFEVTGAGGAPYSGTFANSINDAGAIAGYFIDAGSTYHGFLRTP